MIHVRWLWLGIVLMDGWMECSTEVLMVWCARWRWNSSLLFYLFLICVGRNEANHIWFDKRARALDLWTIKFKGLTFTHFRFGPIVSRFITQKFLVRCLYLPRRLFVEIFYLIRGPISTSGWFICIWLAVRLPSLQTNPPPPPRIDYKAR